MKILLISFAIFCAMAMPLFAQKFELQKTYTESGSTVYSLSVDKSGLYVSKTSYAPNNVQIWETETGKLVQNAPPSLRTLVPIYNPYLRFAYNPDGTAIVNTIETRATIYDTQTAKVIKKFSNKISSNSLLKAVYSPDGKFIATAGTLLASIFDAETGEQFVLEGHLGLVLDIAYSPDGKNVAIASTDGVIKIWDMATKKITTTLAQGTNMVNLIVYSPNGKFMASALQTGGMCIWNLATKEAYFCITGQDAKVTALAYTPDSKSLVVGYENGAVKLWRDTKYLFQQDCELYVQKKLEKWYEKDKFEKTAEFKERLEKNKIEDKVKEWTQDWIDETANARIDWKNITHEYDADHETFQIKIDYLEPIFVKVPIAEARILDRQMASAKYRKVKFGLNEAGEASILSLDLEALMQNEAGKVEVKNYPYNSQNKPAFEASSLNLKYPEMPKIEIPTLPTPVQETEKPAIAQVLKADIDTDLPKTKNNNPHAVAVIIGNTNYQSVKEVQYALRDAEVMKRYVIDVLGFKEENVLYYENAKYTDFKIVFGEEKNPKGRLYNMVKPYESDVFVFYSGHGAPSLNNKKGYFVPVDCDPQYIELAAYPIDVFYDNLANVRAKSLTIVVDACFSGADIFQNISPIVIKPKGVAGVKAGALFSSSTDAQVSCWYNEKGHGMFTYFFLKAIHNKNADKNQDNRLTLKEIQDYVSHQSEGLPYFARRIHGIEQTPTLQGQALDRVLVEY